MAPLVSMLVGGSVGLATGMYSIALQGRLVLKPRISYAVYVAAGGYLGYKYNQFREYEDELIERRRLDLIKRRDERLERRRKELEASASS
ncbi:hypothetical protein H4S06_000887 [Coemansia sp. BCRC 34490]|nr:hypothetical protein H4S06_000887 [Coemansia sp. BCRC 34490]